MFSFKTTNYGDSWHEGVQYGDWYEDNDYQFDSVHLDNKYFDTGLFPGETEPKLGELIHTVIVKHGSGDSFGHSTGEICYLWSFTDAAKAHELAELINNDYKENPDFTTEPILFYDVPISTSTWKGYFEHLESVEVISLPLNKEHN